MTGHGREPNRAKLEADPRFPSGEWKGFYLQRGVAGRQWMALALEFSEGRVLGEGRDSVGEFLLRGVYELKQGRCALTKTYPGSHEVAYEATNEGDGRWLWGVWHIHTESGGFHLWPKEEEDPTGKRTAASKQTPTERKVRLGLIPA